MYYFTRKKNILIKYTMPTAQELRKELKELKASHPDHMPVSRMRKADVSDLIQRMKVHTEETPAIALHKVAKGVGAHEVEDIRTVKRSNVPEVPPESKKLAKNPSTKKVEVPKLEPEVPSAIPKVKAERKPRAKAEPKARVTRKEKAEPKPEARVTRKEKAEPKPDAKKAEMAERMAKLRAMRGKKKKE